MEANSPQNTSATDTTPVDQSQRRLGILGMAGAIYTYVLVVYGGVVRITGSGMGCGDDWPRCNGLVVPVFDVTTFIEYSHRILAAGLSILTLWVVVSAIRGRARAGFAGKGGLLRPALLAGALIILQVLLGAITVKLDLPAGTTALHFMTAMGLLATFATLAVRSGIMDAGLAETGGRFTAAALGAAIFGFVVVGFGALTANLGMDGPFPPSGAAMACQGFPFCNGQLWPGGGAWVQVHWIHRLLAFLLFFHILGTGAAVLRREPPPALARGAIAAMVLVVLQVAVAAALVLMHLPDALQGLHLAVGAGLWAALAFWTALARRADDATRTVPLQS